MTETTLPPGAPTTTEPPSAVELDIDLSDVPLPDDLTENVAEVLVGNLRYISDTLVGPQPLTLRFLRFRPERELRHSLAVAKRLAVFRERAVPDEERPVDYEPLTVDEIVREDPVCDVLTDSLRVHDRNAASAPCPPGYTMPPYPVSDDERNALLQVASVKLQEAAHRCLPGAVDGWTWDSTVSVIRGELVVRFKPTNQQRPS